MGNIKHLELLKTGKEEWNAFKDANINLKPDFKDFDLSNMNLSGYHLDNSDFTDANMTGCNLNNAWLCWCIFIRTKLTGATILSTSREGFDGDKRLLGVNLRWSSFANAHLQNVNMAGATLEATSFFDCDFSGANISGSDVYGVSAWGNIFDESSNQKDLVVSKWGEDIITIDDLGLAQFIYLLLTNSGVRGAINGLNTKIVLILGSFAAEDKAILDKLKAELRLLNYAPMLYDFETPKQRNHMETVSTIAHLAKFIVADLTNPRSIPNELASLIPSLRSVPVVPIIRDEQKPYGMFQDFTDLNHVAATIHYNSTDSISALAKIIDTTASRVLDLIQTKRTAI